MASSYSLGAIAYLFKHYHSPEKVKEMAEKTRDSDKIEMYIRSFAELYSMPYGTFTIPEDKSKDTWAEEHPEFGEVSL